MAAGKGGNVHGLAGFEFGAVLSDNSPGGAGQECTMLLERGLCHTERREEGLEEEGGQDFVYRFEFDWAKCIEVTFHLRLARVLLWPLDHFLVEDAEQKSTIC